MRVNELRRPERIVALKLPVREVSHYILETNHTCNLRCRSCYRLGKRLVKSLADIRAEVDLALTKRNLESISILGGEPTLHPDLPEIVRSVKDRRCICNLLTNGVRFLEPDGPGLLRRLIDQGLDRIVLHADCGQEGRPMPLDEAIERLFTLFELNALPFSLSITLFPQNRRMIPAYMKKYGHYRYYDGLLATIMKDIFTIPDPGPSGEALSMAEEDDAICEGLGITPSVYIPSSQDDGHISWLMYMYCLNADTGRAFTISPAMNVLFRKLYRLLTGRQLFGMTVDPARLPVSCFFTLLFECLLAPGRQAEARSLLRRSRGLKAVRFHYIMIQSGPQWNPARQEVQICFHCPDATLRGGLLTPVCLADLIAPEVGPVDPRYERLRAIVYRHLEQTA